MNRNLFVDLVIRLDSLAMTAVADGLIPDLAIDALVKALVISAYSREDMSEEDICDLVRDAVRTCPGDIFEYEQ
jgi:L-fucose mutarotase/ribose pyranase (RbsD/FucU family)